MLLYGTRKNILKESFIMKNFAKLLVLALAIAMVASMFVLSVEYGRKVPIALLINTDSK